MRKQLIYLIIFSSTYFSGLLIAAPYVPEDEDIVALIGITADKRAELSSVEARLNLAEQYLEQAPLPGKSHLYGQATSILAPLVQAEQNANVKLWLLWATLQQHEHNFDAAYSALKKVFNIEPLHINAHLMASRIYLVQGQIEYAGKHCARLLGHADLLTTSACALEVNAANGRVAESYNTLSNMIRQHGLPKDDRKAWLQQMLAAFAMQLGKPEQALEWLEPEFKTPSFQNGSLSYITQWADVQLALGQPSEVLQHLEPVVETQVIVEDALLLRLAEAEYALGGQRWTLLLKDRIALREQREDKEHASDLARYFLNIEKNPRKALYWAQVNWQSAREASDKALLDAAQAMQHRTKEG